MCSERHVAMFARAMNGFFKIAHIYPRYLCLFRTVRAHFGGTTFGDKVERFLVVLRQVRVERDKHSEVGVSGI